MILRQSHYLGSDVTSNDTRDRSLLTSFRLKLDKWDCIQMFLSTKSEGTEGTVPATEGTAYLDVLLSNGFKMFKTVRSLNEISQQGLYQRQSVQRQRLPVPQVVQVLPDRLESSSDGTVRVPVHLYRMHSRQYNLYIIRILLREDSESPNFRVVKQSS